MDQEKRLIVAEEPKSALVLQDRRALAITDEQYQWNPQQVAALEQLGVENASQADLMVFFDYAKRTGLDPFMRQIYMIERSKPGGGKRQTIQTGIDGFRVIAQRTGKYGGRVKMEWADGSGRWYEMWPFDLPPVAARVYVRRIGWPDLTVGVAMFREYAATKYNGDLTSMWLKMPAGQLAKCAEAQALRTAFPLDLGGMYVDEEMEQANNPEPGPTITVPGDGAPSNGPDWSKMIDERMAKVQEDPDAVVGALQALFTQAKGMTKDPKILNAILTAQREAKAVLDQRADSGEKPKSTRPAREQSAPASKDDGEGGTTGHPATSPQKAKMMRLVRGGGITDAAAQHLVISRILTAAGMVHTGPLVTLSDLTQGQAGAVLEMLEGAEQDGTIDVVVGQFEPNPEDAEDAKLLAAWTAAREKYDAAQKEAKTRK